MRLIASACCLIAFASLGQQPKLVVGIVVDQMCYDYLYRFQPHFGKDGFNRFLNKGVNCRNTNYTYVPTYTGPGHASIYTGTTPSNHGIVANEWFDRLQNTPVNCVYDPSVVPVGNAASAYGKVSPYRLETMTITDQLKMTYPEAKVYSVSIKDRSAALPGGHMSDGSYWFDYSSGKFITSSYFMNSLPPWVNTFNAAKNADTYLGDWELLHDPSLYSRKEDNSPYELTIPGMQTPTFPYQFTQFAKGKYNQFTITPFANTLLTDFASTLLVEEELAKGPSTDMLCISYSTPDIAGHTFGPYSLEVEDIYARLDIEIAKLFAALDKEVGKQNYLVFLTADHAVVPVPKQLMDNQLPGGYFDESTIMNAVRARLMKLYNHDLLRTETNHNIYLNRSLIDSLNLNLTVVQNEVAQIIRADTAVKTVITATQLDYGNYDDPWMEMISKGYTKERSGDVIFMLKPGYLSVVNNQLDSHKGTSHGSAFNYDTHVPLLWYGNHLKQNDLFKPIDITDISATLVHVLNIQRVGSMTGKPIIELLGH